MINSDFVTLFYSLWFILIYQMNYILSKAHYFSSIKVV
jgi:hypothetical protein